MSKEKNESKKMIALFNEQPVRRVWNKEEEKWYFSVVDVVGVLTNSPRPRKYWNALKVKLQEEGSQLSQKLGQLKLQPEGSKLSDKIGQLKMKSIDGKFYETDAADVETLLRLIQSIPSPKAEPFKLWLAKVGYDG